MASLYSVANIMKITYDNASSMSMIKILAYDISNVAGVLYPAAAVLIGAIGAFITGTNLGANQLFATMHMAAAENIGINQIMTFASNNAGGSLGNMICPNNVTAACATVGLIGQENKVMRRVVVMFIITCLLYMVLSLLYVYVIFPNVMVDSVHLF
jgi:lactate permease